MNGFKQTKEHQKKWLKVYVLLAFLCLGSGIWLSYHMFQKNGELISIGQVEQSVVDKDLIYIRIDELSGLDNSDQDLTWLYPEFEKNIQDQGKKIVILSKTEHKPVPLFGVRATFSKKSESVDSAGQPMWQYEVELTITHQKTKESAQVIAHGSQSTSSISDADIKSGDVEHQVLIQLVKGAAANITEVVEKSGSDIQAK